MRRYIRLSPSKRCKQLFCMIWTIIGVAASRRIGDIGNLMFSHNQAAVAYNITFIGVYMDVMSNVMIARVHTPLHRN